MTFRTSVRHIVTALVLLTTTTACTIASEKTVTPEESRQIIIAEGKSIIQGVFPEAEPQVVLVGKDIPCGGMFGTDRTRVISDLTLHFDAPDTTLTRGDIFQKAISVLKHRGWTINYTRDHVAGAERKGIGGIRIGVGDSPLQINISGQTECVPNPTPNP